MRVGVIIPVYNVAKTIEAVLSDFTPELLKSIDEILILDNCSTDNTRSLILKQLEQNPLLAERVSLIFNQENYGYGCSIKSGFAYFVNRPVDMIAVLHSDLQVEPSWLLSRYFQAAQSTPTVDLVMASRFVRGSDISHFSLKRRLGNHFFNLMTTLCAGLRLSDAGSAMIMVRRDLVASLPFTDLSNSWYFHPQLNILLFHDPKLKSREIPLHWANSEADSSLQLVQYGFNLLRMLLRFGFQKYILRKRPRDIFQPDPLPDRRFTLVEKPQSAAKPSSVPELTST